MNPLRRPAAIALAVFLVVIAATPVLAAPGGNGGGSAACANGGYLNYTDTAGNRFRNEGACTRYTAKGGVLVPIVSVPFSVTYTSAGTSGFQAVVSGIGLLPGSAVELAFVWPGRSVSIAGLTADGAGNFSFTHAEQCFDVNGAAMSSLTATGTPTGGSPTAYSLALPDASVCPTPPAPFSVTYTAAGTSIFEAEIAGTGLQPGSAVKLAFVWPGRSVTIEGLNADSSGNFSFTHAEQCFDVHGAAMESLTATGTPAGGSETAYPLATPDASVCPVPPGPFSVNYTTAGTSIFEAEITGTGLQPGSAVKLAFVWPDRSVTIEGLSADTAGNFSFTHSEQCRDNTGELMTSFTATGTPAGGSETAFPLATPDASVCP